MSAFSLTDWLYKYFEETEHDLIWNRKNQAIDAAKDAMDKTRQQLYAKYGGMQNALKHATHIEARSSWSQRSGASLLIKVKSYVDDEEMDSPRIAQVAEWFEDKQRRFRLGAKFASPKAWVFGYLFFEQGIVGLPEVGTWQDEPGVEAVDPVDEHYLQNKRDHPWYNRNFRQEVAIDTEIENMYYADLFESTFSSMFK